MGQNFPNKSCKSTRLIRINLVPDPGGEGNELNREVLHLPEAATEVADFLTCIIDVVNQCLVVRLQLLSILVVVLLDFRLQLQHQVDLLTLQEDRVVGRSSREREGAVCAPAFWMLTMRPVGGGGDGVAHAPALSVHNGVHVPHSVHLLVQVDEDLVDVAGTRREVLAASGAATTAPSCLNFLLLIFLQKRRLSVPDHCMAGGVRYLLHGVVHELLQLSQILVVGHDGLLQRSEDVLEVVLGLGANVLEPCTLFLFLLLLLICCFQHLLCGALLALQLQSIQHTGLFAPVALIVAN
mmetsp:Transcript_75237/g.179624  ORF Transcript_75237/g.179624 Transcript_75237/m.179624 type:complete len:296 (+) Transcript_75237:207-1094(+)